MKASDAVNAVKDWITNNPLYAKEILIFVAGVVVGHFVL